VVAWDKFNARLVEKVSKMVSSECRLATGE